MIRLALSNFTVTALVLGLIAAGVALAVGRKPLERARVAEALLAYFLLFSIGIGFFYNFVMHAFFGDMVARFIGWANSPFQLEVAYASLGFAAVGFLAFKGSMSMRLAAIVGPACFLWGAAGGHAYQMATAGNFAPGNAGAVFCTDILVPLIGFALFWWRRRTLADAEPALPAGRGRARPEQAHV